MKFTVIFKGSCFVVVDIKDSLPRNEHFPNNSVFWNGQFVKGAFDYKRIIDRKVDKIIVHHTAGGTRTGFAGPMATAGYVVQDPKVKDGELIPFTGRGWPGVCYHLFIPHKPEIHAEEKLPVIYSCWPADWRIWHTKGANSHGYGICCQGKFSSKAGTPGDKGQPSEAQFEILQAALDEMLYPLFGIGDKQLYCHADYTKPSCPGGTLKHLVHGRRKEVGRAQ